MTRTLLAALALWTACVANAQEIALRHDLDGKALDVLATVTLRFNDELKGKGKVLLQDARSVEDKKQLPHLALLDPDDSDEFFATRPRFRPLHELLRESGVKLDTSRIYPQVADAMDDTAARLLALPMGLSLPVLLINRDAFRKAGVNPEQQPDTWWALQKTAGDLFDRGVTCPLTASGFAWVHMENVASQHGEPALVAGKQGNRVALNNLVNVKHLALLASWQKSRYFHYAGPGRDGNRRFLKGECAMLTGPSSIYVDARRAGMDVAALPLPHYDDVRGARPEDVLPDGMGLWVLAGHKKAENALAARYIAYLMRPEVQKEWVRATGYLPMTQAAVDGLRQDKVFPEALLAAAEKRLMAPRKHSTRIKHGPLRDRLHELAGEEIAFVWTSGRAAKEALDNTVRRFNETLTAGKR